MSALLLLKVAPSLNRPAPVREHTLKPSPPLSVFTDIPVQVKVLPGVGLGACVQKQWTTVLPRPVHPFSFPTLGAKQMVKQTEFLFRAQAGHRNLAHLKEVF